tara:strand:- start:3073 stop:3702 length:630 start_codon:yes stop_codon:yes gene_type:complete
MQKNLDELRVSDLKEIAKERSIKGYYKMKKAELISAIKQSSFDIAEEIIETTEESAEAIQEFVEEATEAIKEIVEDVQEEVEDLAERLEDEVVEEVVEPEEDELPVELYPILGDLVVFNDGSSKMVVHSQYMKNSSGEIEGVNVWMTNGIARVLNKKGRQLNTLAVEGGDILFWPPEGSKAVYRAGKVIIPVPKEEVAPRKWWQFWKLF